MRIRPADLAHRQVNAREQGRVRRQRFLLLPHRDKLCHEDGGDVLYGAATDDHAFWFHSSLDRSIVHVIRRYALLLWCVLRRRVDDFVRVTRLRLRPSDSFFTLCVVAPASLAWAEHVVLCHDDRPLRLYRSRAECSNEVTSAAGRSGGQGTLRREVRRSPRHRRDG